MFMGRKVSSCGRAAGVNGGCKDQCSTFAGLLQGFWINWSQSMAFAVKEQMNP